MAVAAAIVIVMVMIVAAIVMTAVVIVVVMMVIAAGLSIEVQLPCQKCRHCLIGITADTTVDGNIRLFQSDPCTASDAAADQGIDTLLFQKACQRTVTAAIGVHNGTGYNSAVFRFIDLEASSVSEMLEHLPVFISYCDFHSNLSF